MGKEWRVNKQWIKNTILDAEVKLFITNCFLEEIVIVRKLYKQAKLNTAVVAIRMFEDGLDRYFACGAF